MQQTVSFPSGKVEFYFRKKTEDVLDSIEDEDIVFLTNEHIARLYPSLFKGRKCIVIPAGEHTKDLTTLGELARKMLAAEVNRKTLIVGVGGGVITDITGFLASVYMRGIRFGFVPTSLLGMVDAAIGGKNGVNLDLHKNTLGTFAHPEFIVFDPGFLKTLPGAEWSNGFAEIIKYACCFDPEMFAELSGKFLSAYKEDDTDMMALIKKCVDIKTGIVRDDEKEAGLRKLLNFGHTAGHAIENLYSLPHGHAVSIGMIVACGLSQKVCGLDKGVTEKLTNTLAQYYLPVAYRMDVQKVMELLKMDKKRNKGQMDYILLERPGAAVIKPLDFELIENTLVDYAGSN